MKRLGYAMLGVALAASSAAEVRVKQHGPAIGLDVRGVQRGIWTSLGDEGSGFLLNTNGDMHGDGYPSHAARGSSLVASWLRSEIGAIVISQSDATHEIARHVLVSTPPAAGAPAVVAMGDDWLVAWSAQDGSVMGVRVSRNGTVGPAEYLESGAMVAFLPVGAGALLVTMDSPTRTLRAVTYFPAPQPWPIPTGLMQVPLGGHRGAAAAADPLEELTVPCISVEGEVATIAWRVAPQELAFVQAQGGLFASVGSTRSSARNCNGMLNAVRR